MEDARAGLSQATMLKVPNHQVAGHQARNGVLGPLIDGTGRFFKPLQNDDRGASEVSFYSSLSSNPKIPRNIYRFFPQFYGTQLLEASNGTGLHPHLVLEDIVRNYVNPSVLDMKIGSRTWYPEASDEYITKCLKKDRESSSLSLGFRLCGVQVYVDKESGYWKPEKKLTRAYSAEDCKLVLKKFVSSMPSDANPDCCYVSDVYGGIGGIMSQLLELKAWFEEQTTYHFYSCSVLMVYDKERLKDGKSANPIAKLVDFAHVVDGKSIIDHNFLGGLCSLINCISRILDKSS